MARRVLLIDDSEITLKVIASTLTAAGYDVRASTTVTNLASAFGSWSPEVILTDVNMPQVSGVDLCRRLKSSYETAHVPVILYSSLSDAELEVLARDCEADAYLSKQAGPQALPGELARLIALLA
jgi:DNA-binding response OmpR family regulator